MKKIVLALAAILAMFGAGSLLIFFGNKHIETINRENGFTNDSLVLCVEESVRPKMNIDFSVSPDFSVSDPFVAHFDKNGVLIAENPGETEVVARALWYTFRMQLTVREHEITEADCTHNAECIYCNRLFERAHGHDMTEATCLQDGKCKVCGEIFEKAKGHIYLKPTCTEPERCMYCGNIGEQAAIGHDFAPATCTEPSTCNNCGATEGEALGHDLTGADCIKDIICRRCEEVIEKAVGSHDFAEATCQKPKTCKRCGKTEGSKLAHQYSEATCTQKATCTICGATKGNKAAHYYVPSETGAYICAYCGVAADSSYGKSANVSDYEQAVVELVNVERAAAGLGALSIDPGLMAAADVRAQECQIYFEHTRPDGTKFTTAINEAGVSWKRVGENIAAGQTDPDWVVQSWMNSPGHRANILNSAFNRIGVGFYYCDDDPSGYHCYWAQEFAN